MSRKKSISVGLVSTTKLLTMQQNRHTLKAQYADSKVLTHQSRSLLATPY